MGLFNKKENLKAKEGLGHLEIQVLGGGCRACSTLYHNVEEAVKQAGFDASTEYVTDMERVMTYGSLSFPAIVINGKVADSGRVLKTRDVIRLLNGENV